MIERNTKTSTIGFIKEENDVNNERKICTFCGEDIAADFKRCPYCGSLLEIKPSFSENEEIKLDNMQDASYGFGTGNQGNMPDYYGAGEKINENVFEKDLLGDHNYVEPDSNMEKEPEFRQSTPEFKDNTLEFRENTSEFKENTAEFQINTPDFQENTPGDTEPDSRKAPLSGSIMPDSGIRKTENQYNQYLNTRTVHKPPMSNGMKVFLTTICNLIPGIGQIAGVIIAIVLMNAEGDPDRKSFGLALLITSLIMFVIFGGACCTVASIISELQNSWLF